MSSFRDWLDNRTGFRAVVHEALYERIPGGARWRYVWGSTLVFVFVAQTITGLCLWMAYSPSAQTAWESVFYIQNEMYGGWLLRGMHHFFAQAMVVLLALHLMQVVIDGAYRAPREVNFWLGLVLMLIVLALSLTGYLLPWDQKGFWATRVATNLLSIVPLVGPALQQRVVGGPDYGHHTLTRFFALHAGVLPGLLVFFLVLHLALFRRHGICWKQPARSPETTFWPDQVLKDAVASLAVMIVVLLLVVYPLLRAVFSQQTGSFDVTDCGAELGAPADPSNPYSAARPEWYFLFLFQFLKLFEGWGAAGEVFGAVVVPTLVLAGLFAMPIVGKWKLGHRFNVAYVLALLLGIGALTAAAINEDQQARWTDPAGFAELEKTIQEVGTDKQKIAAHFGDDQAKIAAFENQAAALARYRKSKEYLDAVEEADREAERAIALAKAGVPSAGAIALLRNNPKTQGPKLFAQHCASCHAYKGDGFDLGPAEGEPTAPNLFGFASRAWIAGVLNSEQFSGPDYFGNTTHKEGDMKGFLDETVSMWPAENVQKVAMALSAEAQLPGQAAADQKDAAAIREGRALVENEENCITCHKFGDKGELGAAPDLTEYGSREWIIGMISDPTGKHYYPESNDRMPLFAERPGDSPKNRLNQAQIGVIADWLRGDWHEPQPDAPAIAR
jgi:ubiquinol-cytochrome c reductase cytochrome b subunit